MIYLAWRCDFIFFPLFRHFKKRLHSGRRVIIQRGGAFFFFFRLLSLCSVWWGLCWLICFCVSCKKCGDTGVNMLEKSDLGQWSCLHLSLWQAGALGGCPALNKGESERQVRRESALSNGKKKGETWLDCDLFSQRQAPCYKQPFDINLISFTSSLRIKTVKASANKCASPCLPPSVFSFLLSHPPRALPAVIFSWSFLLPSSHFHCTWLSFTLSRHLSRVPSSVPPVSVTLVSV